MAGLEDSGSNPDVSLLYEINGLAKDAPTWFDHTMEYVGEYGLMFGLVLLGVWTWWKLRARAGSPEEAAQSAAAVIWVPLAAAIAVIVNIPIRGFVERPRPFLDHEGLEVLIEGKTDYSFVSDHSTLAMAMAVGIFIAHRKYGLYAIAMAFLAGVSRIYMGVHYPTDVIGGFALGTAVALLLAPLAALLLTPLTRAVGRSRHGAWLIRPNSMSDASRESHRSPDPRPEERDLAA
ncbi:phosphatase PAP2 family protein [Streptomyces sp. SID4919]|uniref:phosphatase PAP2 family protein n=1 Tax=unclassified Streptomyces TaxID=2593676 RepID=UPI00082390F3|nr:MULTISPECIES: phosphatase PAP2 family protein [unclassified Streptomyces]MYY08932.1 phosphatase PAP2 family protein [Streptomyces sp. SID4919]SCK26635.1 undecaprenyl-diphosphatase [Streptomyces sp. AmelKG-E11A]